MKLLEEKIPVRKTMRAERVHAMLQEASKRIVKRYERHAAHKWSVKTELTFECLESPLRCRVYMVLERRAGPGAAPPRS